MLMHGILATIAEYESRNNGAEALKGMTRKAQVGGTPGRAPIGYLYNVGRHIEGREVRMVAVDPERAPLVQWAFEAYATGEWTLDQLTDALAAKGLKALPQGKGVPGPIQRSRVANLLSNRYYLGYVSFRGAEYRGRHQPLVAQQLFDTVAEVLRSRRHAAEKLRKHHHYLKGSVFCARCGSRLCLTQAKGNGGTYDYFFCVGRHQRRTDCAQRYVPVEAVEAAVAGYYRTVRMPEKLQHDIREGLLAELERQRRQAGPEIALAKRRVTELEGERRRLAHGVVDGSIPGDLAREEHERIDHEREGAHKLFHVAEAIRANVEDTLERALALVGRCDEVYRLGGPRIRRLSNQFLFEKLLVCDDEVAGSVLREPWATFARDDCAPAGFEPAHPAPEAGALSPELRGRDEASVALRGATASGAREAAPRRRPDASGRRPPPGSIVRWLR